MAKIAFTSHLRGIRPCDPVDYGGETLADVLSAVASDYPRIRDYVLDDHGRIRKHIAVFLDGELLPREAALARRLATSARVYVMQALSGG